MLQLFAPLSMQGCELLILSITIRGTFEVDSLKGADAITQRGMVTIHRGHMRALTCAAPVIEALSEQFAGSGLFARELCASGWAATYLDAQEGYGELRSSRPHCYRCRQAQTPCHSGSVDDAPSWDPAAPFELPSQPLASRPAFQWGIVGQEVFAGWGGWTKGLLHQGFSCRLPVELYHDPILRQGEQPSLTSPARRFGRSCCSWRGAAPAPGVPDVWQFGAPHLLLRLSVAEQRHAHLPGPVGRRLPSGVRDGQCPFRSLP